MRATLLAALLAAGFAGSATAGSLSVPLNHSVRLGLSGSAASVVIGNPAIADVTVVDSRTLFLSGKSTGATDVVVVDALGRTIYSAEVSVGAARRGHVAVYRGGDKATERTDLACSPRCEVTKSSDAVSSAPASPGVAVASPVTVPMTAPTTN